LLKIKRGGRIITKRFEPPYNGKQYLADTNTNRVHDLDNEKTECDIDKIESEHIKMFDDIGQAYVEEFKDCEYCIEESA
jgi:hypothetical protein